MGEKWLQFFMMIWQNMSPGFRDVIIATVKQWEEQAKETDNMVDDMLVILVKWLLNIP